MTPSVFNRIVDRAKGGPKNFARRLGKVKREFEAASLHVAMLLGADEDTSKFEKILDGIGKELEKNESLGAEHPAKAYVNLGDTKAKVRAVNGVMTKLLKKCADSDKLPDDGTPRVMQIMDQDILSSIQSEVGASEFPFGGCKFQVAITVTVPCPVYFEMQYDQLLLQKIRLSATDPYKKVLAKGVELVKAYDAAYATENMDSVVAAYQECTKFFERAGSSLKSESEKAVLAACDKYVTLKGDYVNYKIQCGAKITLAVVSIGGGLAGLATSPLSFGFSGVIGIWQLMKSCVALAKAIADAIANADDVYLHALSMYKKIVVDYQGSSKAANTAKEGGVELLKLILGDALFQGIGAAQDEAKLAKDKYNGVELEIHALGVDLQGLCEMLEQLAKGCKKQNNREVVEASAAFANLGHQFMALFVNIPADLKQVETRRQWCVDADVNLNALAKATTHAKVVKGMGYLGEAVDFGLGLGASGADTDFGKAADKLNFAIGTFNSVVAKVDEKLVEKLN